MRTTVALPTVIENLSLNFGIDDLFRTSYEYGVTVKHSPESKADALAVHVTWILTPFLKFTHVTSWPTAAIYQIQERGDSVTFKVRAIDAFQLSFNLSGRAEV